MKNPSYLFLLAIFILSCKGNNSQISREQYKALFVEAFTSENFYPEFKALNKDSFNVVLNHDFSDILKVNGILLFINKDKIDDINQDVLIVTIDSLSVNEKTLNVITKIKLPPSSQFYGKFTLKKYGEKWTARYITSGFYDYW